MGGLGGGFFFPSFLSSYFLSAYRCSSTFFEKAPDSILYFTTAIPPAAGNDFFFFLNVSDDIMPCSKFSNGFPPHHNLAALQLHFLALNVHWLSGNLTSAGLFYCHPLREHTSQHLKYSFTLPPPLCFFSIIFTYYDILHINLLICLLFVFIPNPTRSSKKVYCYTPDSETISDT